METIKIDVNDVFKNGCKKLGISLDSLGLILDLNKSTISRYINKETTVSKDAFIKLMSILKYLNIDILDLLNIEHETQYYFHAAETKIVFPINVRINEQSRKDFGYGFYLGESFRQSTSFAKIKDKTYVYLFKKDKFKDLSEYNFDNKNILSWLLFIAYNRGKINPIEYPVLTKSQASVGKNIDIIKGKIADNFTYGVLQKFFANEIDIKQAEACTVMMGLGNQICLKNDEFAASLTPDCIFEYDKTLTNYFSFMVNQKRNEMDRLTENVLSMPKDINKTFSQILTRKRK